MGYTHYFELKNQAVVTDEQWASFCEDMQKVFYQVENRGYPVLQSDMEDGDHPSYFLNSQIICFNGDSTKGLDHETFFIRKNERGFQFCKTAAKPYDEVVCACLILLDQNMPGCFKIQSDGRAEDWQEGLDLVFEATAKLLTQSDLPPGVKRN